MAETTDVGDSTAAQGVAKQAAVEIRFDASYKSETLDYQNGEYKRFFERKDEPFQVTPQEWFGLRRTGYFVLASAVAVSTPAADNSDTTADQSQGQQQDGANGEQQTSQSESDGQQPASEESDAAAPPAQSQGSSGRQRARGNAERAE